MGIKKVIRASKLSKKRALLIERMKDDLSTAGSVFDIARLTVQLAGQIGYFDCVFYVFNEDRDYLIQKAVFGPKKSGNDEILHPIRIGLDRGIVGSVGKIGKSEIIHNTLNDKRYFIDDDIRLSELTVPVIHNGQVIAVIDTEHPKENFYSDKDLSFWEEIASLISTPLSTLIEQEK